MTKLLQKAFERARTLPEERQDQVGEIVMALIEQETSPARLSSSQIEELKRRMADPEPVVSDRAAREFFEKLL